MNVEFIKLSDGATAIKDENGIISKRKTYTSSKELLVENKIEAIDKSINVTKRKVNDYKGLVFLSKHMLIFQPIIVVGATFLGYVFGNLTGIVTALSVSTLICVPATALWGITYPISKRKLKGFEGKLKKAEELKLEFEKELVKERELEESIPINEPISLVQQNEFEISLIDEELGIAYSDAIHSKPQKLVLQRHTNKKR